MAVFYHQGEKPMKRFLYLSLFLTAGLASCNRESTPSGPFVRSPPRSEKAKSEVPAKASTPAKASAPINYVDDAKSNTKVDPAAFDLTLPDSKGNRVELRKYRGKKNLVLVFVRGYSGSLDRHCTNQATRLAAKYDDFSSRDAEVLVVFPGPKDHVVQLINRVQRSLENEPIPFPVLLDESLSAVDKLGIRGDLAKPSSYIIDKQGQVRFAYVGATNGDRPSVQSLLKQLDKITKD
jgi:peroxiredoxin